MFGIATAAAPAFVGPFVAALRFLVPLLLLVAVLYLIYRLVT